MRRRSFLIGGSALLGAGIPLAQDDKWGATQGFPKGWGDPRSFFGRTQTRVGNYSGGYEQMLPHKMVRVGAKTSPLSVKVREDLKFRTGFSSKTPTDYLNAWPVTGLLIARKGEVWFEKNRFARSSDMRMTGWSMSKSVTSLLLGISIDKGQIQSIDDRADKYVPASEGHFLGECTLRNLANMSIGAALTGDLVRDNQHLLPAGLWEPAADLTKAVLTLKKQDDQGKKFLYNDYGPLVLGMAIRRASKMDLSQYAQENLWQPMGAEADATWLTDSKGLEFNGVGFAARIRDWARLGQLVAQRGLMNGTQVVSEGWINEITTWSEKDHQVRHGSALPASSSKFAGYKSLMWHGKSDGSIIAFQGWHGQRVMIHMPSETVLVQTSVDETSNWRIDLDALFDSVSDAA